MYGQQFNFSPGAIPAQQARLAALQQYQQYAYQPMMPVQQAPMQGRMVASIEEAKVAQVPVDGSSIYFPCPSERKIFVKSMDLNGNAIFETYALVNDEAKPSYADANEFAALKEKVEALEKALKGE